MKKTYPSAVDLWLAVILIGMPAGLVIWGAVMLATEPTGGWVLIATSLFSTGLIRILGWPCEYTLTDKSLTIRSGIIRDQIPLADITGMKLSHSILSAPALSIRRVRITLKKGSRLISPVNREQFMSDLESRLAKA